MWGFSYVLETNSVPIIRVCWGHSSQKVGKPSYPDVVVGLRKFYWALLHVLSLVKWFSDNGAMRIVHIVLNWQRYISKHFTMPCVNCYWVLKKYCNLVIWGSLILWTVGQVHNTQWYLWILFQLFSVSFNYLIDLCINSLYIL